MAAGFDVAATPLSTAQLYATALPTGAFDLALVPVDARRLRQRARRRLLHGARR